MKKIYYSWQQVEGAVLELARQINVAGWRPDYIVGLTRGGLVPATMLSHYFGVPMHALSVSLRDNNATSESNLWMAEDALVPLSGTGHAKEILIVDDINDTGATLNWIKQDWQAGCYPDAPEWDLVWNVNVRFATLTNNLASPVEIDYTVWEVNKAEEDCWLVYPWEQFWKK
jgi:uncharacterized protein